MMTRGLRTLFKFALVAALLLSFASVQARKPQTELSAEKRGLKFSHTLHQKNGTDCAQCHAAAQSTTGRDDLLPRHENCADCHDVKAADQCGTCHLSASPALSPRIANYSPKFSHQRHVDVAKVECAVCHTGLDEPLPRNVAGHLPNMAACVDCHEQREVKTDCRTCHLPTDALRPKSHGLNWVYRHGTKASGLRDPQCVLCHNNNQDLALDCSRCHNGDAISSPHPRDYTTRHGQDAHLSDINCNTCHDTRDFCTNCHRQQQLIPVNHFKPNWANRTDGGEHGDQAEFDLESCMACHDQPNREPVCVRCHAK